MSEKSEAIWMPLYVDKYLGDTTHLTTEQHGAYLLLLMGAWNKRGVLPKQDQQLQQISRMTPAGWRKSRDIILAFFDETDEGYEQKRLSKEFEKSSRIIETKRSNGKRGGRPPKTNLNETETITENKPTGFDSLNLRGNRSETQLQLQSQLQKPQGQNLDCDDDDDGTPNSASVDVSGWSPGDPVFLELELENQVPCEFSTGVWIEFREFWRGKQRLPPGDWKSRFVQRVLDQWARRQQRGAA